MCKWKVGSLLLLSGWLVVVHCDYVGQSVRGQVGEGNFTYYSLRQTGQLRLVLVTEVGDADLYVSSDVERPTYNLDEHYASSATCGEDVVHIEAGMKRPVNIAVYGHPRFEVSTYRLHVVVVDTPFDPFEDAASGQAGADRQDGRRVEDEPDEESPSKVMWAVLTQFLQILIEILVGIA